ncbi:MAG: hypothetical protein SV598_13170 [Pseudomonadota bacterium]|nr:hypothetical protein [Pseudomonadota bacterium]
MTRLLMIFLVFSIGVNGVLLFSQITNGEWGKRTAKERFELVQTISLSKYSGCLEGVYSLTESLNDSGGSEQLRICMQYYMEDDDVKQMVKMMNIISDYDSVDLDSPLDVQIYINVLENIKSPEELNEEKVNALFREVIH